MASPAAEAVEGGPVVSQLDSRPPLRGEERERGESPPPNKGEGQGGGSPFIFPGTHRCPLSPRHPRRQRTASLH